MKKLLLVLFFLVAAWGVFSQEVTVVFTARQTDNVWLPLDSVRVTNLDRGWSETLLYPDTILTLHDHTAIADFYDDNMLEINAMPNPFEKQTSVHLTLPSEEQVHLSLFDMMGREVAHWQNRLPAGEFSFSVAAAAPQPYLLEVRSAKKKNAIKLFCSAAAATNRISLIAQKTSPNRKCPKLLSNQPFVLGDNLHYEGFGVVRNLPCDTAYTAQLWQDDEVTFIFPTPKNYACADHPTVTDYDGNVYPTVQIGKQCWMRENLKVLHYEDGTALLLGNDQEHSHELPYYFIYQGLDSLAEIYGLLYSWSAAMGGNQSYQDSMVQGICPNGWHIPSDEEWCEMEHCLAPQSYCTDPVSYHGTGDKLARQLCYPDYWMSDDFTTDGMPGYWQTSPLYFNTSGFSVLPAGFYDLGAFGTLGAAAYFWTADEAPNPLDAYRRYIQMNNTGINRSVAEKCHGFSIRCVLNDQ